jgi:hypothetical protein
VDKARQSPREFGVTREDIQRVSLAHPQFIVQISQPVQFRVGTFKDDVMLILYGVSIAKMANSRSPPGFAPEGLNQEVVVASAKFGEVCAVCVRHV